METTPQRSAICVFCSSSDRAPTPFFESAIQFGTELGRRGMTLVYGGTRVGLMGATAKAAKDAGGRVVGVIPRHMVERGIANDDADELIITRDLRERKSIMEDRAEAFAVLPGGIGTLEEAAEILTLRQLRQHTKPLGFLDVESFYGPLAAVFHRMVELDLAKDSFKSTWFLEQDPGKLVDRLATEKAGEIEEKWFR